MSRPSQPELLDWLATEFVRSGWDIKAMQRLIVTSADLSAVVSSAEPALLQRDPITGCCRVAHAFACPAEVVRDNALAISGLLVGEDRRSIDQALPAGWAVGRPGRRRWRGYVRPG